MRNKVVSWSFVGFFLGAIIATPFQTPPSAIEGGGAMAIAWSAALFPYVIAGLGFILSVSLLIKAMVRPSTVTTGDSGPLGLEQFRRLIPLIAITVVFILLFEVLGFIISAILVSFMVLWYYGASFRKEWKIIIPLAILFPIELNYVFKTVLYVPLPGGFLTKLGIYF